MALQAAGCHAAVRSLLFFYYYYFWVGGLFTPIARTVVLNSHIVDESTSPLVSLVNLRNTNEVVALALAILAVIFFRKLEIKGNTTGILN